MRVDEGLINRLRKNLDLTTGKLDKGVDSPVSDLYEMYRNVVDMQSRLLILLEQTMRSAKDESAGTQKQVQSTTDRKMKDQ